MKRLKLHGTVLTTAIFALSAQCAHGGNDSKTLNAEALREPLSCPELNRVMSDAGRLFVDLKGNQSSDYSWIAKVNLWPWRTCFIGQMDGGDEASIYFGCTLGPFTKSKTLQVVESAETSLMKCFSNERTVKEILLRKAIKAYVFIGGNNDPKVEFVQGHDGLGLFALRLFVYPPGRDTFSEKMPPYEERIHKHTTDNPGEEDNAE